MTGVWFVADIRIADIKRRSDIFCLDVSDDGYYDFEISVMDGGERLSVTGFPYGVSCHRYCGGEESFFFDRDVREFVAVRIFERNNPDYFLWRTFLSRGEATVFDGRLAAQDFLRKVLARLGLRDSFPTEERLSRVPSELRPLACDAYHGIMGGEGDWQRLVTAVSDAMGVDPCLLLPRVDFLSPVFERCCNLMWAFCADMLAGIMAYGADA